MKSNSKKIIYSFLFIIDMVFLYFAFVLIFKHVNLENRKYNAYESSYSEISKVTYQVNMLENDFITKEEFGSSSSYIMKYTDDILFDFYYVYTGTNKPIKLKYSIVANVTGDYKRSTNASDEIYNKKFVLLEEETNDYQALIQLNKKAKINIQEYNNILKDLQQDLKIPLIGNLKVYLQVDLYDQNNNMIDTYLQDVNVTLLQEVYSIQITNNDQTFKNFYSDDLKINYFYLIGLGLGISILIIFGILLMRLIFKSKLSKEEKEIKKIIKVYDDYIVNIHDKIIEKNYKVIIIKEFKELLTLANNNLTTILYYDNKKSALFYVILDKYLYKYEIKLEKSR